MKNVSREKPSGSGSAILLENATIYNGTGGLPFLGDVLIENGKIRAVGQIDLSSVPLDAKKYDCKGFIVCPGFIDLHSHSDSGLPLYPEAECLLRQGIVTTIGGNCGSGVLGASHWDDEQWKRYSDAGIPRWHDLSEFIEVMESMGSAVNFGLLVGHGDIREEVGGAYGHPLSEDEKTRAKVLIEEAMSKGAFGLSSGLEYVPGRFADIEELSELSRPVAASGGIHASHIRNEGPELLDAVDEVIQVAEKSDVKFEISHLKACGPENWGKIPKVLALLDEVNRGEKRPKARITPDAYPYLASSTGLSIVLPDWVFAEGTKRAVELLKDDRQFREKAGLEADLRTMRQGGWDKVVITSVKAQDQKWMMGRNVLDIAQQMGKAPNEAAIDILVSNNGNVGIVRHAMSEDDLRAALKYPETCIVTDGSLTVPEKGYVHPRSVSTYPRVLRRYVLEKDVLSMEEAIKKMTSLPARRLGLTDRGVLKAGNWADVVVFDPDIIEDKSTYAEPWQYPQGIIHVFVNGLPVIEEGLITGKRPGKGLKHVSAPSSIVSQGR